jgi:hypothetical protein
MKQNHKMATSHWLQSQKQNGGIDGKISPFFSTQKYDKFIE